MTTALIITSILLSVAALWAALARARSSRREVSSLRERLEAERQRNERNEARLDTQTAAQEEARREIEAVLKEHAGQSIDTTAVSEVTATRTETRDESNAAGALEEPADVYAAARALEDFFNDTTHPRELLGHEGFRRAVELSLGPGETARGLLARAAEGNALMACIALEALARRVGDDE